MMPNRGTRPWYTLTHLGTIEAGFVRFTAPDNAQLGADTFYFVHLTFRRRRNYTPIENYGIRRSGFRHGRRVDDERFPLLSIGNRLADEFERAKNQYQ